ncbi:MAG: NADH-quinone oxidoreductase subunit J [Deltaproteobacteria bacterium]|nr:NADH-quinone oxidoreductase subunit J [Deltaproteobacteria bacterium]
MELTFGATDIFFYVFSGLALLFALFGVVLGKNPISCAFSLVLVFFCVAGDYALLQAHFVAAIQILVYAGAIMVLFVFVIMLLNADTKSLDIGRGKVSQVGAGILCLALLAMFVWSIQHGTVATKDVGLTPEKIESLGGNLMVLSTQMFSDYILPFELTSLLLLVGIVGSVALAKRRVETK